MLDPISLDCRAGPAQAAVTSLPAATRPPTKKSRSALRRAARLSSASCVAYSKDARLFKASGGTIPCDTAALLKYVMEMRNKIAPRTLYRRCMAVRYAHLSAGMNSPTDDVSIRSLLRLLQLGHVPDKKALLAGTTCAAACAKRREPKSSASINRRLLEQMLAPLPRNLLDRRDRAMLLLAFTGALKRSELVALDVGDLRFTQDALVVTLRRKGEPEPANGAEGSKGVSRERRTAVPITGGDMCAATAVREWVQRAALDVDGRDVSLFRRFDRGGDPTPNRLEAAAVNLIVKKWVRAAGIDPARYSAHSLVIGRRSEVTKGLL